MKPRAVAYVRVSMEGGRGDDLMSPEIQLTAIRDHCARQGYTVTEVLEDIDKTGRLWKRRQIERAVTLVEQRAADVVVVWKVSRVSRNRKDWAIAVDRVESVGGRLESATEPLDATTSTGRFTRGMLAELAAFESERIGETWKEVHNQRTSRGLPHYGPPRFGYAYTKAGGYVIDPETSEIAREVYRRYTAGVGVATLVHWLTAEGVRVPKSGGPWGRYGLKYWMDSGHAAGFVQRHDPACKCRNKGSCKKRLRHDGAHEAILTPAEWAAYLAARDGRQGVRVVRAETVASRLTGLVICAECDRVMQLQGGSGKPRHVYACRHAFRRDCPSPARVRRDACEQVAREWLAGLEDEIARAAAMIGPPAVSAQRRERIERQIIATSEALTRLTVDLARGLIPEEAYRPSQGALSADLSHLRAELDSLPTGDRLEAVRLVAVSALAAWDDDDEIAEVNRMMRLLIRIRVARGQAPVIVPAWEIHPNE